METTAVYTNKYNTYSIVCNLQRMEVLGNGSLFIHCREVASLSQK